jgi:hypothetical protein
VCGGGDEWEFNNKVLKVCLKRQHTVFFPEKKIKWGFVETDDNDDNDEATLQNDYPANYQFYTITALVRKKRCCCTSERTTAIVFPLFPLTLLVERYVDYATSGWVGDRVDMMSLAEEYI